MAKKQQRKIESPKRSRKSIAGLSGLGKRPAGGKPTGKPSGGSGKEKK